MTLSAVPRTRFNLDNRAQDLTKEGMLEGIRDSAAFILLLTKGVLSRPYCQVSRTGPDTYES